MLRGVHLVEFYSYSFAIEYCKKITSSDTDQISASILILIPFRCLDSSPIRSYHTNTNKIDEKNLSLLIPLLMKLETNFVQHYT